MDKHNKSQETLEQKYPGIFGSNMAYGSSGLNQTVSYDVSGELTDNKGAKSVDNQGTNISVVGGESQREKNSTASAFNKKR